MDGAAVAVDTASVGVRLNVFILLVLECACEGVLLIRITRIAEKKCVVNQCVVNQCVNE